MAKCSLGYNDARSEQNALESIDLSGEGIVSLRTSFHSRIIV